VWYIGDTPIQGDIDEDEENSDSQGKADYIQTLTYYANSKHNGQRLRCEIEHQVNICSYEQACIILA
jgi:hypothetical protein